MTVDEVKGAIQELKAQGLTEEAIAACLYGMYQEDKIDLDQFGALVKLVGYDLSDEFMAMSDEEKKNQEVGQFGMDDSEQEDSEQEDSNEGAQEEPKKEEDENPFEKYNNNKPSNSFDKKDDDEDDEEKEAKKMYGF
jgi:hypothetical protein